MEHFNSPKLLNEYKPTPKRDQGRNEDIRSDIYIYI